MTKNYLSLHQTKKDADGNDVMQPHDHEMATISSQSTIMPPVDVSLAMPEGATIPAVEKREDGN